MLVLDAPRQAGDPQRRHTWRADRGKRCRQLVEQSHRLGPGPGEPQASGARRPVGRDTPLCRACGPAAAASRPGGGTGSAAARGAVSASRSTSSAEAEHVANPSRARDAPPPHGVDLGQQVDPDPSRSGPRPSSGRRAGQLRTSSSSRCCHVRNAARRRGKYGGELGLAPSVRPGSSPPIGRARRIRLACDLGQQIRSRSPIRGHVWRALRADGARSGVAGRRMRSAVQILAARGIVKVPPPGSARRPATLGTRV